MRRIAILLVLLLTPLAQAQAGPECLPAACGPISVRPFPFPLPDPSALQAAGTVSAALAVATPDSSPARSFASVSIPGLPAMVREAAGWLLGAARAADRVRASAVPGDPRWRAAAFRALGRVHRSPGEPIRADETLRRIASRVDLRGLKTALATLALGADRALAAVRPVDGPCDGELTAPTEYADGQIAVDQAGTRTRYTKPYVLSIDLGGCDEYLSTTAGANGGSSIALDLGGHDDVYVQPKDTYALGSASEGVGLLVDDGGDDLYRAQSYASMGAGIVGGVGLLADLDGDDRYEYVGAGGGFGAHGNGTIGAGALVDLGGNDLYRYLFDPGTASFGSRLLGAQGAGTVASVGVLADAGGDDVYEAITLGNTVSIEAQGAADFVGAGMLLDAGDGDDVYRIEANVSKVGGFASGSATGQGMGVLHGTGLLLDGGGDDTYALIGTAEGSTGASIGANGQGFGTAVIQYEGNGALVDLGGNDTRTVSATATADDPTRTFATTFAQGAGFFLGQGVLVDMGGADTYSQTAAAGEILTAGQGAGVGAATGTLLDRGGPDRYSAPPGRSQGYGGAYTFSDITVPAGAGALVDGAGRNVFSGPGRDASVWFQGQDGAGVGIDGGRVISTAVDTVDGVLYLFGFPRPGAVVTAGIDAPTAGAVLHGDTVVRGTAAADGGLEVEYVEWRTDFDPWELADHGPAWATWSAALDVDRLADGYHEVIARAWAQGVPSANAVASVTVQRWLPAWDVRTQGEGLLLAFALRDRKGEAVDDGEVALRVLDASGVEVAWFDQGLFAGEGRYQASWEPPGPGAYTLRAEIPGQLLGETTVQT